MLPKLYTYYDVLRTLDNFANAYGKGTSANAEQLRETVLDQYDRIATARDWLWLRASRTLKLNAAVETTAAFDLADGSYERQLTVAEAVLDTAWMYDATVMIDDIACEIEDIKSSRICTLTTACPQVDYAAGEAVTICQKWVPLPNDFLGLWQPLEPSLHRLGTYRPLEELQQLYEYDFQTGDPKFYSIGPAEGMYGTMALHTYPAADSDREYTLPYKRRPRDLRISGEDAAHYAGTASISALGSTLTGVSTSWDSSMEGSVIWLGTSATNAPTGLSGRYPYKEQRIVKTVTGATSLTMDGPVASAYTGVKCRVTDPVDLSPELYRYFLACAKLQLAIDRGFEGLGTLKAAADEALLQAACADAPVRHQRIAGRGRVARSRLSDSSDRPVVTYPTG